MKLEMLFEAADFSTAENLEKAIRRGQAGISPKKFFVDSSDDYMVTLKTLINSIKNRINQNFFNSAIMLILRKTKTVEKLKNLENYTQWLDILQAYFSNKDKQVFKTNAIARKLKQDFENNPYDFTKDKKLEDWINKNLAEKQQIKDVNKEIEKIYDDGTWNVTVPKTFAAAKRLACMGDKKAHWCTSANASLFRTYTSKTNKLFVIRSEKNNKMFQMDWGKQGRPNFMDINDRGIKYSKFLQEKIPDNLLKAIKNSKGESVYDMIQKYLPKKGESEPEGGGEDVGSGWMMKKIPFSIALNELKGYSLSFSTGGAIDYSMSTILKGAKGKVVDPDIYRIKHANRIYYLIDGEVSIPRKGTFDNLFIEILSNNKAIKRMPGTILKSKKIPDRIKRALIGAKEDEKIEIKHKTIYEEGDVEIIRPSNRASFSKFLTRKQFEGFSKMIKSNQYNNYAVIKKGKKSNVVNLTDGQMGVYTNYKNLYEEIKDLPKEAIEKLFSTFKGKAKKSIAKMHNIIKDGYIKIKENPAWYVIPNDEESCKKFLKKFNSSFVIKKEIFADLYNDLKFAKILDNGEVKIIDSTWKVPYGISNLAPTSIVAKTFFKLKKDGKI